VANATQDQQTVDESSQSHNEQERLLRRIVQALGVELDLEEDFMPGTLDEDNTKEVLDLLVSALRVRREARTPSPPIPSTELPAASPQKETPPEQPASQTQADAKEEAAVPQAPPAHTESAAWEEVEEEHPVPTYGLESPVIAHLLSTWTTDANKVRAVSF
jgi:hypothetical protein